MSLPTGAGKSLATCPAPEKLRLQGATAPFIPVCQLAPRIYSPIHPRFSGFGIGTLLNSPKLQDAFLWSAKEGSNAILLPESSVIVGRSAASYKRDGLLELQERLPEELSVALIWIYGVESLQKFFEKNIKGKIFPRFNHLSSHVAWNRPWGKASHVDLSPQEMFAKNHKEINSLLKIKSVRWAFSVGLALGTVAYIIPKLNQYKTNLLLQFLSRRKRQLEGSNVQFGDPPVNQSPLLGAAGPAANASTHPNRPTYPAANQIVNRFYPISFLQNNPYYSQLSNATGFSIPAFTPSFFKPKAGPAAQIQSHIKTESNHLSNLQGRNPQFGSMPGGALLQGTGHMVEQTPYGCILVVDAGITGGRGYVASKRSLFETAEVVIRDIGSLYFYVLFAPHMMKLTSALTDSMFNTSMGMQPKVAEEMNKLLLQQSKGNLSVEKLKKLIHGASESLMESEGLLKKEVRFADLADFRTILTKESSVYLANSPHALNSLHNVLTLLPHGAKLSTDNIRRLLNDIQHARGNFPTLSAEERQNLSLAVKQAFRHTAGLSLDDLASDAIKRHPAFKELFNKLEKRHPQEIGPLIERIQKMARLDVLDQTHSMLRRSINLFNDSLQASPQFLQEGNQLAELLDQAVKQRLSLKEMLGKQTDPLKKFLDSVENPTENTVRNHLNKFMNKLSGMAQIHSSEKALLEHYRIHIAELMNPDKGRLFSLAIAHEDRVLGRKIREMLKGGLQNNSQFLSKALGMVGQLETDSRKYVNPVKANHMRESIVHYTEALLRRLDSPQGKANVRKEMESFYRLNRNLHYGVWSLSLISTMLCLGWLVPQIQTTITKRLTGRDKNPGIAHAVDEQEKSLNPVHGRKAPTDPMQANAATL